VLAVGGVEARGNAAGRNAARDMAVGDFLTWVEDLVTGGRGVAGGAMMPDFRRVGRRTADVTITRLIIRDWQP
jgi:hypothetical protein